MSMRTEFAILLVLVLLVGAAMLYIGVNYAMELLG